ncbi:MAG TPA: GTP-binding protein, partial [Candidatus Sulfotelmatobacter sp.]
MQPRDRVAALVGDLATENDAVRLARSKAPVKQITTGTLCHLEAAMVQNALQEWDLHQLDFLFIENVGNLVCPSSYDLGENLRLYFFNASNACFAAAIVRCTSSSVCAAPRNAASYCEGGRYTPLSSILRKNFPKASVFDFDA